MKKRTLFYLFICIIVLSCENISKNKIEDKAVNITIIFKNPNISDTLFYDKGSYVVNENKITYRIKDSYVDNKIEITNKKRTVTIKTSKPIFLYHQYYIKDFCYNSYCFQPGDTLIFKYLNGIPYVESIKNSRYNYNFGSIFNLKIPLNFDETLFYNKFKRFKNEGELIIDKKAREERESYQSSFFDSLKNSNLIDNVDYSLNLSYINNKKRLASLKPLDILKKSYNLADIGNTFLISNAFEMIYKPKFITISDGRTSNFSEQFENARLLKKIGKNNREYLMFSYLEKLAKRSSKSVFLKHFSLFEKETNDISLLKHFKTKYPLMFEIDNFNNNDDVILYNLKKNGNNLKTIIDDFQGKVIYVDLWASWCAPCRKSMPNSIKLNDEFKSKGVEFIYISIDNDFNKWKKAIIKDNISFIKNNFITTNYPQANLFRNLEIITIPRYLIFNKKGELVNSNAPSPDSKDIKAELQKHIEE